MTLKTSSRNINPFFGMIKSTVRKNFGIIIVLCIAALLYCPGSFIVNWESLHKEVTRYGHTAADFTETFGNVIKVFAPLFVLLFNFVNFSFLYKKSASDVYHAFPLTRTELLLSRMSGGIISTLVPVVLVVSCYVTMGIFNPWLCDFGVLFYDLVIAIVLILLWSSFSLVFVVCAGSAFDLTLSFLGTNLGMFLIAAICNSIFDDTLLGYTNRTEKIYNILSLPYFCINVKGLEFWAKSIIYIALFTAAAILLYNKRKAEKGGTAFAYKFMYYFCSVLASICGGYVIGILFDNDQTSLIFWFFMSAGAVLFALIYGLITNRGFKGSGKATLMGGIATVTLISITIISATGGLGFSKRVPSNRSISEVEVLFDGNYIVFTDPATITALHKKVVENSDNIDNYSENISFYFNYKLKNGTTLERRFIVSESYFEDEILAIYKSDERLEMIKRETKLFEDETATLHIRYNENNFKYEGTITPEQYERLLEIYWGEVQSMNYWQYNTQGKNLTIETRGKYNDNYYYIELNSYHHDTIEYVKSITYYTYQSYSY